MTFAKLMDTLTVDAEPLSDLGGADETVWVD
jgi:hypothetical protein